MTQTVANTGDTAHALLQTVMACGAGMTGQAKIDALNTYGLADRAASRKFPDDGQEEARFRELLKVLADCGWVTARRSFEKEQSTEASLTLGAVAFKAVSVAGQAFIGGAIGEALGKLAGKALEQMGLVTEAQSLFKYNAKTHGSGSVGLVACLETESGDVVMALSTLSTQGASKDLDSVPFEWKSASSDHYIGKAYLVFNKPAYEQVRGDVEAKLGVSPTRIVDIDIG